MSRHAIVIGLALVAACKGGDKSHERATRSAAEGGAKVDDTQPARERAAPTEGSAGSAGAAPVVPDAAVATHATTEAKLARYQECLAATNATTTEALAGCYADDAVREQVDSVPELIAQGAPKILEMVSTQKASFPDLALVPRLVVASGGTIVAIVHISGTAAATGKKPARKLGVFQAEIATMGDDGKLTHDSFYVDQPTIFHQLGLLPNDTSPGVIAAPAGTPELLASKGDEREAANKELVQKALDAMSAKNAAYVEGTAADDIKFTYHGEKQRVEGKRAYARWIRDTMKSTSEAAITVTGMWAAGDVVAVANVFEGTPSAEVGADGRRIKTSVVQFFRIVDGKVKEHQIFANRLNTAVQLGFVEPAQLLQTLANAAQ